MERRRGSLAGGLLVLVLGAAFLAANFGWLDWADMGRWWPVLLIAAGLALLLGRERGAS